METDDRPRAWVLDARDGKADWSLGSLTVLKATAENTDGSFSPAGFNIPDHDGDSGRRGHP